MSDVTREVAIKNLKFVRSVLNDDSRIAQSYDMAISALSTDGEYIKKLDILNELGDTNMDILTDEVKEIVNGLPSYSFPDSAKTDTAKPEEGAELIDRRQIKWYGCDHEGHIKGINCDTADCSKCFYATVEHDEVMSLPIYRVPNSSENKGEWIPVSSVEEISKEAVWVTRKGADYAHVELIGWDSERNCRTEDGGFRCDNSDLKDVVAYIPYSEPEPYKENEA